MANIETERLKPGEITANRIFDAAKRRIADLPHKISWEFNTVSARKNKDKIRAFGGKHKGERCVIMGNGPSLKSMDLSALKEEVTFGLNRIYLLFDKLQFETTYLVSFNELVLKQFSEDIAQLSMPKFLNWNIREAYPRDDEFTFFLKDAFKLKDEFSPDITQSIYSGGTVTYVAMQIAYYMGFNEVYLIGVDHSFSQKGIPNKVELRQSAEDQDHFHPQYFPKGSKWQLPDLDRSEMAYKNARSYYEQGGRKIFDATVGGKCEVFEKVDYYSVFSG